MTKLTKLKITCLRPPYAPARNYYYQESVLAIDYEALMPNLEEIEFLNVPAEYESHFWDRFYAHFRRQEYCSAGSRREGNHVVIPAMPVDFTFVRTRTIK